MRPGKKQKAVDRHKREYCREHHCCEFVSYAWKPADATEIWIKESHGDELFQEFVARLLQKHALMEQRAMETKPEPTVAHPVIQALANMSTEARRVVWTLNDQVAYDGVYTVPPDDSDPGYDVK